MALDGLRTNRPCCFKTAICDLIAPGMKLRSYASHSLKTASLCCSLIVGWAAFSLAEEIINDDFSQTVGPTIEKGTFPPLFSKVGTKWIVEKGKISTDGTPLPHDPSPGQLAFDRSATSQIRIDFGSVSASTPAKISFDLRQWDGADSSTGWYMVVTVGDSTTGQNYRILMSLGSNFYGARGGGMSGVGITDATGRVQGGKPGAHLPTLTDGQAFHNVSITFDPNDGIAVYFDDEEVATMDNREGLTKVDYFTISNEGKAAGHHLSWFMDNFSVDAVPVP